MSSSIFPDETTAAALEAMPDAVIAVDGEGKIRFANTRAEDLSAFSNEELIGQKIEFLVPRSRRSAHRRDRADYQRKPTKRYIDARRGLGLQRKDGSVVQVSISLSPLSGSTENIVLGTIQDVSEQERRSKEYLLLDELGSLAALEHDVDKICELLGSSLPVLFEFDRLIVTARLPATEMLERIYVSGRPVPGEGVGTLVPLPEKTGTGRGALLNTWLDGAPEITERSGSGRARSSLRSWVAVPFGDTKNPFGFLNLQSQAEDAYGDDDLRLLGKVASIVSPAFEIARLYAEARKEAHERTVLAEISRIITSMSDIDSVYDTIADRIRELVPFDRIVVATIDRRRNLATDRYVAGLKMKGVDVGATHSLDNSLTGEIIADPRPRWFTAEELQGFRVRHPGDLLRVDAGLRSVVVAPLIWDDEPMGVLILRSRDENAYGDPEAARTMKVASQIVGAVANDLLRQEVARKAGELNLLAGIGRAIGWVSEDRAVWEDCARLIAELIPAEFILIQTIDRGLESFVNQYQWFKSDEQPRHAEEIPLEGTVTGEVVTIRKPIVIDNTLPLSELRDRFPGTEFGEAHDRGIKSIVVPLFHRGDIVGVLHVGCPAESMNVRDNMQLVMRVADQVAGQISSTRLLSEIRRESEIRDRLAAMSRIMTSTRDLHDVFGQFAGAVRGLVPADQIHIRLMSADGTSYVEPYRWDIEGIRRPSAEYSPIAGNPMELLISGQSSIVVDDHNRHEMRARFSVIQQMLDAGSGSIATTAIRYQGKVIGGLMIASVESGAYGTREVQLLEAISAQISGAVVNAEQAVSLSREASRRRTLAEIGRVVSSSFDVSNFFDRFAIIAKELIPFESINYADFDPVEHLVTLRYQHGGEVPVSAMDTAVNSLGTVVEKAVAAGEAIMVADGDGRPSPLQPQVVPAPTGEFYTEVICVPLTSRNKVFGCLSLTTGERGVFTREHLDLATLVADQVSGAISNAHSYDVALQAERDSLESEARSRELERLNEERSTFLSTVSHELKTPLTSLTAFADILARNRESNLSTQQLVQVQVMQRSARRLDVLINDLLDVSRLDAGEFKLTRQSFEVKGLIEELRTAFVPILQAKDQMLNVRYPDEASWLDADQNRIAQLISNLLSNASKYSGPGAEVDLKLSVDEGSLSIVVEDHGFGMSAETLENLFTPFFRSNDEHTQSEPGTGLGLVIVKSIAELHGGTISVSSKQGEGTRVQVSLPQQAGNTTAE